MCADVTQAWRTCPDDTGLRAGTDPSKPLAARLWRLWREQRHWRRGTPAHRPWLISAW